MAKETKKTTTSVVDINEENFDQFVNNIGKFSDDEVALADEKDAQEIKERKAREFNSIKHEAGYQKGRIVADCVYAKKAMEAQKKCMKAVDELYERIRKGELDRVDYENAREKAIEEAVKEVNDLGKTRRATIEKLKAQYPNHWSYSWDNPFQRLNRAIEDNKRG